MIVDAEEVSAGARVHWLLYGVAGSLRELPERVPPLDTVENIGIQGTNGFGNLGRSTWTSQGPCKDMSSNKRTWWDVIVGRSPARAHSGWLRTLPC